MHLKKNTGGGTRSWTMDLSICSRLLYHWAIPPMTSMMWGSVIQMARLFPRTAAVFAKTAWGRGKFECPRSPHFGGLEFSPSETTRAWLPWRTKNAWSAHMPESFDTETTHWRDPTTAWCDHFELLGFPPGPFRDSLGNLAAPAFLQGLHIDTKLSADASSTWSSVKVDPLSQGILIC